MKISEWYRISCPVCKCAGQIEPKKGDFDGDGFLICCGKCGVELMVTRNSDRWGGVVAITSSQFYGQRSGIGAPPMGPGQAAITTAMQKLGFKKTG